MNKYNYLIVIMLFLFSNSVFAGDEHDGFFTQIGAGLSDAAFKFTTGAYDSGGTHFPESTVKSSDKTAVANFALGYSKSFSNNLNLGITGFYMTGNQSSELFDSFLKIKIKNITGFSIDPGYWLDQKTLVYIKLGYARSSIELSALGSDQTLRNNSEGSFYGIGAKRMISSKIFVNAEVSKFSLQPINFGSTDFMKPDSIFAIVNVGYLF